MNTIGTTLLQGNLKVLGKTDKYANTDPYNSLKKGIWIYFILLIFEGALRKWALPDLATPLLLVRDPVAIWLLISAWKHGIFYFNIYVIVIYIIGFLGLFTAILFGHGNFWVALYGMRTLIVHFPVIFIIGSVFNREDVIKLGRFVLWLTIPMTILLILQFYSPQSAWVNRGIGGNINGGGFNGAMGFFRPPATFSFTNGTGLFYGFSTGFIFYFWLSSEKQVNRLLLIAASTALLMSIPLSISRSLFFIIVTCFCFSIIATLRKPKQASRMIIAALAVLVLFLVLSQLSMFQTATQAFTERFTSASEQEGGLKGTLGNRYFGGMIGAITNSAQLPFFGYGIGMGTNVGSVLLTGKNQFLVAEGEWGRLIGELGIVMGLGVIIIRLSVTAKIAFACYKKLTIGDILPWLLLSFCLLTLPQAQWSQPTSLGFSVFIAGLVIASMRSSDVIKHIR